VRCLLDSVLAWPDFAALQEVSQSKTGLIHFNLRGTSSTWINAIAHRGRSNPRHRLSNRDNSNQRWNKTFRFENQRSRSVRQSGFKKA